MTFLISKSSDFIIADAGKPITVSQPDSASAQIYFSIARKVLQRLEDVSNKNENSNT
jgi:hypothetical protein